MKLEAIIFLLLKWMAVVAGGKRMTDNNDVTKERMSEEKRLVIDILAKYKRVGRQGRPVLDDSKAVPVKFGLGLIQMDLDEKLNVLTMSMWAKLHWKDEYLTWDPGKYGNVTSFRLKSDLIWIPDIMLYNTASVENPTRDALAVIFPDGSVHWFPHTIYKSTCKLDIVNFPFDQQKCHLWFGSWTHPSPQLNLSMAFPGGIDLSTFQSDHKEGSAWDVYNVTGTKAQLGQNPPFHVLQFQVSMRRRMVFATYMLTLPCVFLACLTMVVFWLPPDRPDRISLAMALFSSFMLLLLILVGAAPPTTTSVPTLGVYYCFNLVLIMVSILLSTMVVNITRPGGKSRKMPRIIYATCRKLEPVLLWSCSKKHHVHHDGNNSLLESPLKHTSDNGIDTELRQQLYEMKVMDANNKNEALHNLQIDVMEMKCLLQRLERAPHRLGSDEKTKRLEEWKLLGTVLDRIFFITYLILVVTNLAFFFPRPVASGSFTL